MYTSFGFLFYFSSYAIFSILCLPWLFLDSFRRKMQIWVRHNFIFIFGSSERFTSIQQFDGNDLYILQ